MLKFCCVRLKGLFIFVLIAVCTLDYYAMKEDLSNDLITNSEKNINIYENIEKMIKDNDNFLQIESNIVKIYSGEKFNNEPGWMEMFGKMKSDRYTRLNKFICLLNGKKKEEKLRLSAYCNALYLNMWLDESKIAKEKKVLLFDLIFYRACENMLKEKGDRGPLFCDNEHVTKNVKEDIELLKKEYILPGRIVKRLKENIDRSGKDKESVNESAPQIGLPIISLSIIELLCSTYDLETEERLQLLQCRSNSVKNFKKDKCILLFNLLQKKVTEFEYKYLYKEVFGSDITNDDFLSSILKNRTFLFRFLPTFLFNIFNCQRFLSSFYSVSDEGKYKISIYNIPVVLGKRSSVLFGRFYFDFFINFPLGVVLSILDFCAYYTLSFNYNKIFSSSCSLARFFHVWRPENLINEDCFTSFPPIILKVLTNFAGINFNIRIFGDKYLSINLMSFVDDFILRKYFLDSYFPNSNEPNSWSLFFPCEDLMNVCLKPFSFCEK